MNLSVRLAKKLALGANSEVVVSAISFHAFPTNNSSLIGI